MMELFEIAERRGTVPGMLPQRHSVTPPTLAATDHRWPASSPRPSTVTTAPPPSTRCRSDTVHAVIGALNLFAGSPRPLSDRELADLGQATGRGGHDRDPAPATATCAAARPSRAATGRARPAGSSSSRPKASSRSVLPPTWTARSGCSATMPATPTSASPMWPGISLTTRPRISRRHPFAPPGGSEILADPAVSQQISLSVLLLVEDAGPVASSAASSHCPRRRTAGRAPARRVRGRRSFWAWSSAPRAVQFSQARNVASGGAPGKHGQALA